LNRLVFNSGPILALLIAAAFFWLLRIIEPATTYEFGSLDYFRYFYPMSHRAAEWMLHGVLPLWNPYQFSGHPFLATLQTGIFYPPNFVYLLLPTEFAIEAAAVLHFFAAGAFTYWYARVIALGRAAALIAGIIFMLSGYVAFPGTDPPAHAANAWLPLAFVAMEKIFQERQPKWAGLLGVAVAMPILAGSAQLWTYMMYAIAAYGGARLVALAFRAEPQASLAWPALLLGAGTLFGLCLSAVQLLPSMELALLGPRRPGGLSLEQLLFLAQVPPHSFVARAVLAEADAPPWTYLSMSALVLIPISLLASVGRGRVIWLWSVGLLSLGVALTVYTPIYQLLQLLPTFTWFRIPQRILGLYAFAGAMLAGIGFQILARARATGLRGRFAILLIASFTGLAWLFAVEMPARSHMFLIAALFVVWSMVLLESPRIRQFAIVVLLGLMTVDLFQAQRNTAIHPIHNGVLFRAEHEALDFVKLHQGLFRTYIRGRWWAPPSVMAKQGTLLKIYSVTDDETLNLERLEKLFVRMEASIDEPRVTTFTGVLDLDPTPSKLRLLDLLSVRFIVAPKDDPSFLQRLQDVGWQEAFTHSEGVFVVYENKAVLPRAYVAHHVVAAEDEHAALAAITEPSFDSKRTVVLEPNAKPLSPNLTRSDLSITEARIEMLSPTQMRIETDDSNFGYLVLTDTFYPGWRAEMDGQPQEIYRANYLFRALSVPPGRHTVTYVYNPLSFNLGAMITGGALLIVLGLGAVGLIRQRAADRS
jgi:Bacterial membrane protein YfhO